LPCGQQTEGDPHSIARWKKNAERGDCTYVQASLFLTGEVLLLLKPRHIRIQILQPLNVDSHQRLQRASRPCASVWGYLMGSSCSEDSSSLDQPSTWFLQFSCLKKPLWNHPVSCVRQSNKSLIIIHLIGSVFPENPD
jgi:hypothetical protein